MHKYTRKHTHMEQNPDIHVHGQTSLLQLFNVPILAGSTVFTQRIAKSPHTRPYESLLFATSVKCAYQASRCLISKKVACVN